MEAQLLLCEANHYKTGKAAFAPNNLLFQTVPTRANLFVRPPASNEREAPRNTLQMILDFAIELADAEWGSLVLLNRKGTVTDSILSPGTSDQDLGASLTNQILCQRLIGWVSSHRQIALIADTVDDDHWLDCPHLQQPTTRSVMVVPVLWRQALLGVLTLTHPGPNHFSLDLGERMQTISDQIALSIETASAYANLEASYRALDDSKKEIEASSQAIKAELEMGRQFQAYFLPDNIPRPPNWDIATYFAPAKQVSGDFYDVFALPGNQLGIVIADVCDKGVGSGMYMALIRSLIRIFSGHISLHGFSNFAIDAAMTETAAAHTASDKQTEALNAVKLTNDYIVHEHGKECIFVTLFFGVINPLTGSLTYINGGHEPLFIVDSAGVKKCLEPTGPALGLLPGVDFDIRHVQMQFGDILIGYTDGVTEASSSDGDFFSKKRLLSILKQPPPSVSELIERIKAKIFAHIQNSPPSDDITMLAVQRLSSLNLSEAQAV